MDDLRLENNKYVFLKRIEKSSRGFETARLFLSEEKIGDTFNHCVPVLGCFEDERLLHCGIFVTPLLRTFNRPQFISIDEVVEFVRQTLEVHLRLLTSFRV